MNFFKSLTVKWESYCHGCGLCCHEKSYQGLKTYINLATPCEFLGNDRRCTVYARRFKACRDCSRLTLINAIFSTWLPDTCGYVVKFRPWRRRKRTLLY